MSRKKQTCTSTLKLWKFFTQEKDTARKAFHSYHLVKRKYIVAHAAKIFDRNKLEPAPLLNLDLLDIGCGTSKLAEEMTFRGANVTAIDPSEDCIKTAKKQAEKNGALVSFIPCTSKSLIKKEEKFDIILCMDIFEHINHTSDFMRDLNQLLKPNGIILFSSNNRNLESAFIHIICAKWLFKWVENCAYKFKRFRTPKKLIGKFEDNGFKIIDLCGVYLDPSKKRWRRCAKPASRYLGAAVYKNFKEKPEAIPQKPKRQNQ